MYLMNSDIYVCDICGFEGGWDDHDDIHGELWGCERCGSTFCTKCFIDTIGKNAYWKMMQGEDVILCPECYEKQDAE